MPDKKRKFACAINLAALISSDCYFDVLGSLVIVLDRKGYVRLFNSGAEEMLGYKDTEVIGKNWFKVFIPKETTKAIQSVFDDMVSKKTPFIESYTNEVVAKDGKSKTLNWHSSVLLGSHGYVEGIVATATDVTEMVLEKKRIEELEEVTKNNELKFKSINDTAKDPIIMMNSLGNIISWNKAAEIMFGYKESEVFGKNLHHFIVANPEYEKSDNILKFGHTGESSVLGQTIELPVKNRKGKIIQIELSVSRVKLFKEWHAIGIMRDITEKKQSEEAIRRKVEELEKLNNLMVGRELKMIELKAQIANLIAGKSKHDKG